jgi:uncharacterized membrane protein (UPF0127 family)
MPALVAILRLLLLMSALTSMACSHSATSSSTVRGEPTVILTAANGQHIEVKVELARTEPERQRGLMFRQSLAPGRGMLFIFEQPQKLSFWMKNTYIPLDMIFIDAQKRVLYIEENAEPLTFTPRGPSEDSQYVLEVPGGWARAHGVQPGVEVRFSNVD